MSAVSRIKLRALAGGHNIPEEDVIRRFYRSRHNFLTLYRDLLDSWALYYNGGAEYTLIAEGEKGAIDIFDKLLYDKFLGVGND